MQHDGPEPERGRSLYRANASPPAGSRLFGAVTVVVPPSGLGATFVGLAALLALGFVAYAVEIPHRARAIGVLMPPDGFLDVVATAPGRITSIDVTEGQPVTAGAPIVTVSTDQEELVLLKLESVREELGLLVAANVRQKILDAGRAESLDEQLDTLGRQLAAARDEYTLQRQQIELLERRLQRHTGLAVNGNLSSDDLDQAQSQLLQARATGAAMRRAIVEYEQQAHSAARTRVRAQHEAERRQILHDLERHRLQRQVAEYEFLVGQVLVAPAAGTVARINVQAGAAIRAGDALARIYRRSQGLEAWLYLSSAKAGFLRAGQTVQLRLDAYPYQLFGTSEAVVRSVSEIAIVPQDLKVPLPLDGPVFEVRATLDATHVDALDTIWKLAPGTSFQADLVQRRYRLYEWLLRAVAGHGDRPGA